MNAAEQINFEEYLKDKHTHVEVLHSDSKGWITLADIEDGKYSQWHYKYKDILKVDGENNVFISQNTFYKPCRRLECIKELKALYIDLDMYKTDYTKEGIIHILQQDYFKRSIPEPNLIIDSGRGLYLVWRIKAVPSQALPLWKAVEDYLYKVLKDYGADARATDATRILRVCGTVNTKSNSRVSIIEKNDYIHTLREIQNEYLPELKQLNKKEKPKGRPKKAVSLFNSYSLVWARIQDLVTICELRAYDLEGHREIILFLYRYWNCIYIGNAEDALNMALELNREFKKPLSDREVITHTKSAERAYLYLNKLYKYTNKKLIEILDITEYEQTHLKTIISIKEKNRRKNEVNKIYYKAKRRNENGLTKREQDKQNKIKAVKELYKKGLNQIEIAEMLGIRQGTVSKYLNK